MNDVKSNNNNFDYPPNYNAPIQPQSTYNNNNTHPTQSGPHGNFQTTTPISPMMNQQSMQPQIQMVSPQMTGHGQQPQMMNPQMTGMNASMSPGMGGQQQPAMMMNVMMTPGAVLPPQNLLLVCQQNGHLPTMRYGACGIVTAILCFPIGLIALFIDVEQYCTRCGARL